MMMRQMVTYLIAAPTCKAFASANPAFGAAFENSDPRKLIDKLKIFTDTKIKMLKQRFEETPEDSWDIWHNGNI
jgi:hypothetical protein